MQTNHTPTLPASVSSLADAQVSESLKEQAQRHMPDSMRSWAKSLHENDNLKRAKRYERALALEAHLNALIKPQAEARRQFVEGAR